MIRAMIPVHPLYKRSLAGRSDRASQPTTRTLSILAGARHANVQGDDDAEGPRNVVERVCRPQPFSELYQVGTAEILHARRIGVGAMADEQAARRGLASERPVLQVGPPSSVPPSDHHTLRRTLVGLDLADGWQRLGAGNRL